MPHADFYPFPLIAGIKRSTAHANYEIVAKLTLDFLDKVLRADSTRPFNFYDSNDALHDTNILSVSVNPALQVIPYEEEVLTWLRFGNIEKVEKSLASHGSGLVDAHNVFFTTLFLARDNAAHTVKAVEIFCRYFPSHPNLGMLFNELENNFIRAKTFTNAIEIFSRFAKLMPASPYPHKSLARIYFQLKNRKEAGVHLDRAIEKIHQSSLPGDTRKSLLKEIADMKAS
jgi:tetratricopeptide (TPR) repeat protein